MLPPRAYSHLLIASDHLLGVEAVPKEWVEGAFAAGIKLSPSRPSPVQPSAPPPVITPRAVPARPSALPPAVVPSQSKASWSFAEELPSAPRVLFVAVEWGLPIEGDVRMLFDRQVAAMKLKSDEIGLLRATFTGADEPTSLAPAKAWLDVALARHPGVVLVLMGGFTLRTLLGGSGSLALARGRFHDVAGRLARATWHPGQLGVDRQRRAEAWEDLQAVMKQIGLL